MPAAFSRACTEAISSAVVVIGRCMSFSVILRIRRRLVIAMAWSSVKARSEYEAMPRSIPDASAAAASEPKRPAPTAGTALAAAVAPAIFTNSRRECMVMNVPLRWCEASRAGSPVAPSGIPRRLTSSVAGDPFGDTHGPAAAGARPAGGGGADAARPVPMHEPPRQGMIHVSGHHGNDRSGV